MQILICFITFVEITLVELIFTKTAVMQIREKIAKKTAKNAFFEK